MSKEDIEKLDKQIELLKKDKNNKTTGEVETVVTEIHDSNDENHVVNISYINSEVKESTKEIKNLKTLTKDAKINNDEFIEDTKEIVVTKNLDAIVENDSDELPNKVDVLDNKLNDKKSNKTLFIIFGIIIGILLLLLVICLFIFSGNKEEKDSLILDGGDTEILLSEDKMIEIVDLYGKSLENEITKYYNNNGVLPNFSIINNLVDLEYEVVCHVHEIYDDKTVYLDECMVDYIDIDYAYGSKKEIKEEVVDNNNVKVYVHKKTKKPTLDEPVDKDAYYLYSSNVDSNIENIQLLNDTVYLTYFDTNINQYVLYNYVTGKKAFYKVDYSFAGVIILFGDDSNKVSSEYVVLHLNNNKSRIYSLTTGEAVSEEYDGIGNYEIASNRISICNNNKCGMLNLKTGDLVIPLEYDQLNKNGNSIIAQKNNLIYVFDEDGNRYLEDVITADTTDTAIYDKYLLQDNKIYNLNSNVICEFDTDNSFIIQRNKVVKDKLVYYVKEENENKCYIYDISKKECFNASIDECNKLY